MRLVPQARRIGRGALLALALMVMLAGCRSAEKRSGAPAPAGPPPEYGKIVRVHNERAARLAKLWARGSAVITWIEEDGTKRVEQGEGHFQVVQPSNVALSIGKLGEVLFWLGCDDQLAWAIWTRDDKRAMVGPHSANTRARLAEVGIAASPRDLIRLAGLAPLPESHAGTAPARAPDGTIRFDIDLGPAEGAWRYWLAPDSLLAKRIALLDSPLGAEIVTSSLDVYLPVTLRREGGFFPTAPSRLRIRHEPSGSSASLTLESMNDGGGPRLAPANFVLASLLDAYNVSRIIELHSPEGQ